VSQRLRSSPRPEVGRRPGNKQARLVGDWLGGIRARRGRAHNEPGYPSGGLYRSFDSTKDRPEAALRRLPQ
jgi:hypothetical protein